MLPKRRLWGYQDSGTNLCLVFLECLLSWRKVMLDKKNKLKVKEFLKVNLETLKGEDLAAFMEKYDIREAGAVEMMMLDHGMPGQFVAIRSSEPNSYYVATLAMVEKILFLNSLDPEKAMPDS
jgi:hypothetical protein